MKKKCRTICIILFAFLLLPYIITVLINGKSVHGNGDNSPFYVKVQAGERDICQKKIMRLSWMKKPKVMGRLFGWSCGKRNSAGLPYGNVKGADNFNPNKFIL